MQQTTDSDSDSSEANVLHTSAADSAMASAYTLRRSLQKFSIYIATACVHVIPVCIARRNLGYAGFIFKALCNQFTVVKFCASFVPRVLFKGQRKVCACVLVLHAPAIFYSAYVGKHGWLVWEYMYIHATYANELEWKLEEFREEILSLKWKSKLFIM